MASRAKKHPRRGPKPDGKEPSRRTANTTGKGKSRKDSGDTKKPAAGSRLRTVPKPHRAAHLVGSAADTGAPARPAEQPRVDDRGKEWTRRELEHELRAIVSGAAHVPLGDILLSTRFQEDLAWDEWFILSLLKPIRRRLHEDLSDFVLLQLETVGDLVSYVWSRMEVPA